MDILEEIVAYKRIEVEQFKAALPFSALQKEVEPLLDTPVIGGSMREALMQSETGIISEFKPLVETESIATHGVPVE